MKRLLAQIGITYFSVLAAAYYCSDTVVMILGGIALVTAVILFCIRKIRKTIFLPAMALVVFLACAVNIGYTNLYVQPITDRYAGGEHTVEAVLKDEPYQAYAKHYYYLRTSTIDGEKVSCDLLLKMPHELDVEPDDVLTFTSELSAVNNNYYRSKGYYLVSDSYDTVVSTGQPDTHSLYYYAIQLRRFMRKALDVLLSEDCAALCRAVLIGDKYALAQELRDQFRYAGVSYYVVVSGMHFAIIVLILNFMLRKLRNRWIRLALMLLFMLLYAAVTGFQPSVLRSGIMAAITAVGVAIRWQRYPLNNLGLAGIIMPFIVSPYGAGEIGLILSFYATMAILLWAEPIAHKICFHDAYGVILQFRFGVKIQAAFARVKENFKAKGKKKKKEPKAPFDLRIFLKKTWNMIGLMLSVSLAANILVFPISVFVFHAFSLVTILSAILLYIEIYLILILSLVVCIFFWMGPLRYAAILISWVLYGLCRLVLFLVVTLGSLPFSYFRVSEPFFYVWLVVTILLVIIVFLYRDYKQYLKTAALCSAAILLSGSITYELLQTQSFSLEVYPCDSGICAGINHGGRLHLLQLDADSESVYRLLDDLTYRYCGAASALCCDESELVNYQRYTQEEFAISSIMLYDKSGKNHSEERMTVFDDNSVFLLDDAISVQVSVIGDTAVPYVTAGDKTILIIPRGCTIDSIPEKFRQADVIVLCEASEGMEQLRCDTLIVSDPSAFGKHTALALRESYHHVCFTDQGEVHERLR